MPVAIDEFLRWLEARGVDGDRQLLYRECAQRILREAGGAPVEAQHIDAARRGLEREGAQPQLLLHVRSAGDALRRFQRVPATAPARTLAAATPAAAGKARRPERLWPAFALLAIAAAAALGEAWLDRPNDAQASREVAEIAPGSPPLAGDRTHEEAAVRRAYTDFERAMLTGDLVRMRALAAQEKLAELSAENAAEKLEMARALYPRDVRISTVEVDGESAVITARAALMEQTARGRIDLVKEDAQWKVRNLDWKVTFSADEPAEPEPKPRRSVARPADFPQLIGTWRGKEVERETEWTISFSEPFALKAQSSRGEAYEGEVSIRWDLGVEDGVIHVPPGWAPMDVEISAASMPQAIGKIALSAFSLSGGELRLCGGPPGLRKRVRSFESPGQSFRCMVLSRTSRSSVAAGTAEAPYAEPAPGEATLVLDGVAMRYELKTGFSSDTRAERPERAVLHFGLPGGGLGAQRIVLTLDATRTGLHVASGEAIHAMLFDDQPLAIGVGSAGGSTAVLKWIADGGQVYPPKVGTSCAITVSSPYTGRTEGAFAASIDHCIVHSAGIDHTLRDVKIRVRGALER
jgi:hypothetical protein